jgi:hypothetical protein
MTVAGQVCGFPQGQSQAAAVIGVWLVIRGVITLL